jgi:hypothetical protein
MELAAVRHLTTAFSKELEPQLRVSDLRDPGLAANFQLIAERYPVREAFLYDDQGRLVLRVVREPLPERRGIGRDHPPEQHVVAERDRGEDVLPRAARDQEVHHVATRLGEAGSPADRVHPVIVALALHLRARVEQKPH